MRRAIAVTSVIGLGMLAVVTGPAAVAERASRGFDSPRVAAPTKVVSYLGLQVQVPANWPVYRLDLHPSTCVRYDIHAVYLGTPGPDQQCPAHLVGRTQTVSIVPAIAPAAGTAPVQPGMTGGVAVGTVAPAHAALMQDAQQHVLRVRVRTAVVPAATVLATYAASPGVARQVLASLRAVPARARKDAGQAAASVRAPGPPTTTLWRGVPAGWPVQIVLNPPPPPKPPPPPPPRPKPRKPVRGFDTCTAPTLHTMKVWRPAFAAVGIYIGGVNAACAAGNLSASWVRGAEKLRWALLPVYVGPQSACWGGGGVLINPKHAAAQGAASANDAVADTKLFGLSKGSPVYYDMEAYDENVPGCVHAVLNFIGGWSRQLKARGYLTGAYSSQNSGIHDMQAAAVQKTPGFTRPGAIWIALWDGKATLEDGTLVWPLNKRNKQFLGPHNKTLGGITLNIDTDLVGGPAVR